MYSKMKFALLLLLALIISSCSDKGKQDVKKEIDSVSKSITKAADTIKNKIIPEDTLFKNVTVKEMSVKEDISDELEDRLDDVFSHYIKIKNELANNDSLDSKKHALEMLQIILQTPVGLSKIIDNKWKLTDEKFNEYKKTIESANTLDEQRKLFNKLSISMLQAIQKYGLSGKTVYEMESKNSLDGKNGVWVVDSKNSDDPYTGEDNKKQTVRVIRGWEFD